MKHCLPLFLVFFTHTCAWSQVSLKIHWYDRHPHLWLQYEQILPLDSAFAVVVNNHLQGLVRYQDGAMVSPCQYHDLRPLDNSDHLLASFENKWGVIRRDGETLLPVLYDSPIAATSNGFRACKAGQCRDFSEDGQLLPAPNMPKGAQALLEVQDGYCAAKDRRGRTGLLDSKGHWAVKPLYESLRPLGHGCWLGSKDCQERLLRPAQDWESQWHLAVRLHAPYGFWAKRTSLKHCWFFYDWQEKHQGDTICGTGLKIFPNGLFFAGGIGGLLDTSGKVTLRYFSEVEPLLAHQTENYYERTQKRTHLYLVRANGQEGVFGEKNWVLPPQFKSVYRFGKLLFAMDNDSVRIFDLKGSLQGRLDLGNALFDGHRWIYHPSQADSVWHVYLGWIKMPPHIKRLSAEHGFLTYWDEETHRGTLRPDGKPLVEGCKGVQPLWGQHGHEQIYPCFSYTNGDTLYDTPLFDQIEHLGKGYFLVRQKSLWGVASPKGEICLDLVFEDARFKDTGRYLMLKKAGYWQVYNRNGTLYLDEKFLDIAINVSPWVWGQNREGWQAYFQGKPVLSVPVQKPAARRYGPGILLQRQQKYGVVAFDGKTLLSFDWDTLIYDYCCDFTTFFWGKKRDSIAVLDDRLQTRHVFKATDVRHWYYKTYAVQDNGLWLFFKANGKPLRKQHYVRMFEYADYNHAFWAERPDKTWERIDNKGNVLATLRADSLYNFIAGYIGFWRGGHRWLYHLGTKSERTNPYEYVENPNEGYFIVYKNGKVGIIDRDLKALVPCEYDGVHVWGNCFLVERDKQCGLLDINGQVILPLTYKVSAFFQGKYLQLYKDYTFGLFDEQGKTCIPIDAYEGPIEVLDNDKFVVQTSKHTGVYFKTTGQWVLDSMESITPCDIKTKLSHSFYRFRKNGLYGVMGENCQEIVPPQYAEIRREGRFLVMQTPYHPPKNGLQEGYKRILYDIFSLSSGTILAKGKSRIAW